MRHSKWMRAIYPSKPQPSLQKKTMKGGHMSMFNICVFAGSYIMTVPGAGQFCVISPFGYMLIAVAAYVLSTRR